MSGAARMTASDRFGHEQKIVTALKNPWRRKLAAGDEALDHRLECPLGRLAFRGLITQQEYDAGRRWQEVYMSYLACIGAPSPFSGAIPLDPDDGLTQGPMNMPSDDECEKWTKRFKHGRDILMRCGRAAFHSVNAIAVYEETMDRGDRVRRIQDIRTGLRALAKG